MREEDGFGVDRSKRSGRKSQCKECDRRESRAYYAEHREELYARREAVREAAWQAHLEELEKAHKKRLAAMKREHAEGERRQKDFLTSIGVPDPSQEDVTERSLRGEYLPGR